MVQHSHLDSHSKIVSILNPRDLQLQPGGDLGEGKGIKATSVPNPIPRFLSFLASLPKVGIGMLGPF